MKKGLLTGMALCATVLLMAQPQEFTDRTYGNGPSAALLMTGQFKINGVFAELTDYVGTFDPNYALTGSNTPVEDMGIMYLRSSAGLDDNATPEDEGLTVMNGQIEPFTVIAWDASADIFYQLQTGNVSLVPATYTYTESTDPIWGGYHDSFDDVSATFDFDTPFTFPALPIVLFYFELKDQGESVLLDWATAVETDNDFFTLERSTDGEQFRAIGTLDGAGTTDQLTKYQWVDTAPLYGTSYYRIKQTDYDGTYTYTPVRSLTRTRSQVTVTPNPAQDEVFVTLPDLDREETVTLTVFNQLGQPVLSFDWTGRSGVQALDLTKLARGTYHLQFQSRTLQASQSLMKL